MSLSSKLQGKYLLLIYKKNSNSSDDKGLRIGGINPALLPWIKLVRSIVTYVLPQPLCLGNWR